MNVKLPKLLDSGMREVERLRPGELRVEPSGDALSTATMTLSAENTRLRPRDWVELFTAQGSAGIYRVTRLREETGGEQRVTLTHGLCALEDAVLPGEGTLSGDAAAVIGAILARQKRALWTLGDVAQTGKIACDYNCENALEVLQRVQGLLPDYALTFDQSALPWRLGLMRLPEREGAEARLSRNLRGVTIEEDDSELCTRVYVDEREGYIDGPTIDTWGPVERVLTVPEGASDAEVKRYVDAYLEEHKNPARTILLDADDLSDQTGEELDAFRVWKLARVPLPLESRVLRERITALSYPDVLGDGGNVRVTMGARERTVSDMLAALMRRADRAERGAAGTSRRVSRNAARIEEHLIRLEATYQELVQLEGATAERFNQVSLELDAMAAEIRLRATRSELGEVATRVSSAEIRLSGAEAAIALKAEQTSVDALGERVVSAEIAIDGANAEIALKVNKNGVIAAINVSSEEIKIQASRINLQGYVTASQLSAELAEINKLLTGVATINKFAAGQGTVSTLYVPTSLIYQGYTVTRKSATVVTGASLSRTTNTGVNYSFRDYNGEWTTVRVPDSVASVSLHVDTDTIYYLAYA